MWHFGRAACIRSSSAAHGNSQCHRRLHHSQNQPRTDDPFRGAGQRPPIFLRMIFD
jgi:hypothetical protein